MSKSPNLNPPKSGSKLRLLVEALQSGSTVQDAGAALDWQDHTVRAAMTRLRQRGYKIERVTPKAGGSSIYRLAGRRAARG